MIEVFYFLRQILCLRCLSADVGENKSLFGS